METNPTVTDQDLLSKISSVEIDGVIYNVIKVGRQLWMAENLKSKSHSQGISWDNGKYGRLYDWDAAMSLNLPDGWRIPSTKDWNDLNIVPDGWNLQLGGFYGTSENSLGDLGSYGYWWSSTPNSSSNAYFRILNSSAKVGTSFSSGNYNRSYGFSVRCVRDLSEEELERIDNFSISEEQAIKLLKSKGYRILKPIMKYEEV